MNYIIDGDIDFWKELNDDTVNDKPHELCLLTNTILGKNHITLPCEHKFNYVPLYNEIVHSKMYQKYNKYPLKYNQVKCPYCRTTHDKLLVWIPHEELIFNKLAASSSATKCLPHKQCEYCFKSGKNKGKKCDSMNAYESKDSHIFCSKHWKQFDNSKKTKTKKGETSNKKSEELTKHEKIFLKKNLKKTIQTILKNHDIPYKSSATKLVLMRTMQLNNIPLHIYDENHNTIILSTPMYSV